MKKPRKRGAETIVDSVFVVNTSGRGSETWIIKQLNDAGYYLASNMAEATIIVVPGGLTFTNKVPLALRSKAVVIPDTDVNREVTADQVLEIKNAGFRDVYLRPLNLYRFISWIATHLNGKMPTN